MVTRRTFKQLGPVDFTSDTTEYTVNYEEDGITLNNTLDVPPIAINSSINFTSMIINIYFIQSIQTMRIINYTKL